MRFYAEHPARMAGQVVADLLVIVWVVLVVRFARGAQALVEQLEAPARALASAGESVRSSFAGAAQIAAGIPLIGGDLARSLDAGTGAGQSLTDAGVQQVDVVARMALGLAVVIVVLAAVPVVIVWLNARLRYAVAAGSATRARVRDVDLLALRALVHQDPRRLLAVSTDPAAAWRRDDPVVIRDLAALELHMLGLRAPRRRVAEDGFPPPSR